MLRLNRLILSSVTTRPSTPLSRQLTNHEPSLPPLPSNHLAHRISPRFFDIYQGSADELNRGYLADMFEFKQHGGKFPALEVNYSDGRSLKLPISFHGNEAGTSKVDIPKASLLCLSFRASYEVMIDSWSKPFFNAFSDSKTVQLYEISLVDSRFLSLSTIKRPLLRIMKKSKPDEKHALLRQTVHSFCDNYYFRKELKILNLLTGYIFLVDMFGRIRWQGFGMATEEELASLMSCTKLLLEEK